MKSMQMIVTILMSLVWVSLASATTVQLQWNPNTESDLAGYKVYYKADSSALPFDGSGAAEGSAPVNVLNTTTASISGLDPSRAYNFAITAYNTAGVESSYSNIVSIPESLAPTTSITFPAGNSSVSGTVSVTASASDNVGISKVEFYLDNVLQATDTTSTYLYSWNTTTATPGSHTLIAKAYDAAGNVGVSSTVTVQVVNDITAPTASITSPAANATVSGTVTVTANALDNVGISRVEFFRNNVMQAAVNTAPYSYNWNTTSVSNGSYSMYVRAYDAAGNVGQSSTVNVTVFNDTTAPAVAISAPAASTTVNGTVAVTASATDNVAVANVEFFVNGTLHSSDTAAPYSFNWNTTAVANGSYSLTAKAYDAANNATTSSTITVTAFNDTITPSVSISSPANGATVNGSVMVTAAATDNVGVTKVEFYVDGVLKSTDTTAPYSFTWDTTIVANGVYNLTTKAFDATGNVGQAGAMTVSVHNPTAYTVVFGNVAGTHYPGTIQDTYINLNSSNNSSSTALNIYTWPANKPANAIVMQWDISALPANAQVQSATLNLYMNRLEGTGGDSLYEIPVSAIVSKRPDIAKCSGYTYDGLTSWTANSVAYSSIPLAQADIGPVVDAPVIDKTFGYKSWNVTTIVKDWLVNPVNNNGLLLNSSTKASSDSNRMFAANEVADPNQRPKLVVTYTILTDTVSPAVTITAPATTSTVSGAVAVTAGATDNIGVTKVEFYLNNVLKNTVTTAPYSFIWDTKSEVNGSYSLTSKAYDAANNVTTSAAVSVTVFNDTTAPVVAITAPTASATVTGTVVVTALATDNVSVSKVEFYLNGVLKRTLTSAPYIYSWDTKSEVNGSYSLTSKAYDAANNVTTSAGVSVVVFNDTTAPTVAISAPAASATVSDTVAVTVTATDNVGVSKVEFYLNGVLKSAVTATPYIYSWDTKSVVNGSYSLTSKAYDAANNVTTSAAVNVAVFNDTTAPVVAITSPTASATVTGTVLVTASATDNVGVSKVEFYLDGILQSSVSTAPYSYTWDTSEATNGSHTLLSVAYDAVGNVGQSSNVSAAVANDYTAPALTITSKSVINQTIAGTVSDNVQVASVMVKVGSGTPVPATITGNSWTCNISLPLGVNGILVTATDSAGNVSSVATTMKKR